MCQALFYILGRHQQTKQATMELPFYGMEDNIQLTMCSTMKPFEDRLSKRVVITGECRSHCK